MPKKVQNKYLLLFMATLLLAIPVYLLQYAAFSPQEKASDAISGIPKVMGPWKGSDAHLEQWVYELLETRSIIHRSYARQDRQVFLSVVYYADTKVGFHAPESCLGAQGLELTKSSEQIQLGGQKVLDINQLTYQQQRNRELVYYFYKAGSYIGPSYIRMRLNIAYNKLFTGNRSGALIRVSTPMVQGSDDGAKQLLSEFIDTLFPHMVSAL